MCLLFVPPAQLRHAGWGKMFAWILSRLELATIGRQALLREPEHGDMLRRRPRFQAFRHHFDTFRGLQRECRALQEAHVQRPGPHGAATAGERLVALGRASPGEQNAHIHPKWTFLYKTKERVYSIAQM